MRRDKKSEGVDRGEMGRSLVTTGRMVTLRSIGYYKQDEKKNVHTCFSFRHGLFQILEGLAKT